MVAGEFVYSLYLNNGYVVVEERSDAVVFVESHRVDLEILLIIVNFG